MSIRLTMMAVASILLLSLGACASASAPSDEAATSATSAAPSAAASAPSSPFLDLAGGIEQLGKNPIFQLAQKDAADTLAWVDSAPDAPTDALTKAQAKVCPQMVQLAIADFQEKAKSFADRLRALDAKVNSTSASGGPELILAMTKLRYSTSAVANPQAELAAIKSDIYNRVSAVVNGCRNILPTKQLAAVARIAVKAGVAVTLPGTAPLALGPAGLGVIGP